MSTNEETDESFDEEELADGFDEEIVGEEELEDADIEGDDVIEIDDEEILVEIAVPEEEEDVADDADVELALDEVLAETIRRTSTPEDDDEVAEVDTTIDPTETILPKQDDEFRCDSCRLLKKTSQLADKDKMLCRDCV
ncbi:MAG: hypothetical protein ABSC34_05765 [Acidimicrobiales bacterium]|jgi:hypothetical protein